jgi:hypothetical protein
VVQQQLASVPPELAEIRIVGIERLLPSETTASRLIVRQSHIAVEIGVQVAEVRLSVKDTIPEEGSRTAPGRVRIADQHLAPKGFTPAQKAWPDLLVGSGVIAERATRQMPPTSSA